ncbi:hypothetical protein [Rhodomicrobium vannielii]|uniref:hypothetical protein n=1 Tax=Rhodomicrobium vannielii TaxID=1069 RepID=UPI0012DBEBF1|nr:hypothetical protein [Rhodomicrobium vannielii]
MLAIDEARPESQIEQRVKPEKGHQVFFFVAELLIVAREFIICEKYALRAVHAIGLLAGSSDSQQLTNLRGMKGFPQTVDSLYNPLSPHVFVS